MSTRRKNLLEAFQTASPASSGAAAGPLERKAPAPEASLFEGHDRRPAWRAAPRWLVAVVGLTLAFVLGFFLGRRGETRAEEADPKQRLPLAPARPAAQPRTFQERSNSSALPSGSTPEKNTAATSSPGAVRIEDSALYDTQNVYTVVVAAYSKSNQDLAWATHQHLADAGLAVFPPVASGNVVLVLAGAAPTSAELEKTEASIQRLKRDGKAPYADAYRARIDKLIPDRTPKGN